MVTPNLTVVPATPVARRPVAPSITQCPVNSVPLPTPHGPQPLRASAGDAGLPRCRPSNSSIESHPTTTASPARSADRLGLLLGQDGDQGGGVLGIDAVLVHPAHRDLGVEAGVSEEPEPGRRARGEDQRAWAHGDKRRGSAGGRTGGARIGAPDVWPDGGCAILVA